jgi:hypothetical protein
VFKMADDEDRLLDLYHDEIKRIGVEYQGPAAVLYCCVLSVVNFQSHNDLEVARKNHSVAPVSDVFSSTGEFISLQTFGPSGVFQGLVQTVYSAPTIQDDIIAVDCDDNSTIKLAKGVAGFVEPSNNNSTEYTNASVAGLLLFEKHALVRSHIANIISGKQYPLKPQMSSTERGIMETELLSFSSLSATDLYRNDQLRAAAEMLQTYVKALPNFTGSLLGGGDDGAITRRRYFRHLSPQVFAQILSTERVREPVVVKQYYPLTDDLLLALHWPPPERRIRKESWSWTGPIPVASGDASAALAKEKSVKGKKGKGAAADKKKPTKKGSKVVEVAQPTTMSCTISTTTLTPAAHSIALLKRSATDPLGLSWLTIHVNNAVLGLRMETCSVLTADFLAEQEQQDIVRDARDARSIRSAQSHESLPELGEDGVASPAALSRTASQLLHGEGSEHHGDSNSATKLADSVAKLSTASLLQEAPRGVFFCHAEDDIRFSVCAGPSPQPIRKPDGFGTVCLMVTFPDTMALTVCSNGTTKITLPQLPAGGVAVAAGPVGLANKVSAVFDTAVGTETERYIGAGGAVMSLYSKASPSYTTSGGSTVQFAKEIREADGSRVLIVRPSHGAVSSLAKVFSTASMLGEQGVSTKATSAPSAKVAKGIQGFYQTLCGGAPEGWTCVRLAADGQVLFYTCPPDSSLLDNAQGVPHPTLHHNTCATVVDAETRSTVATFPDGRILVTYADGRRECKFGDGTVLTTHADGVMVSVTKPNLPAVEVDTEIDAVSRQHARGIEVPINKGGERVRSRIALPDGTAVVVSLHMFSGVSTSVPAAFCV